MDNLIPVWNRVNDPREHPGSMKRNPVTWEQLGGKNVMLTVGMRGFDLKITKMIDRSEHSVRFSKLIEAMYQTTEGTAVIKTENYRETLDLYTKIYPFGKVISPQWSFAWSVNYREVIDEIAKRGLILHGPFGHVPFVTPPVPPEVHRYISDKLGDKFTGWDNGEHDCRFTLGACDAYEVPKSLEEGYEHFLDYEYRIEEHLHHEFCTLSNNTFQPYLADMKDTRMIGNQLAQSKPNINMWCALLRGAGKQYGLLWWGSPSEWNAWDAKAYGENVVWGSPTKGTSLSLIRRIWFLFYMYGGALIMTEHAVFDYSKRKKIIVSGREREVPELSPIGKQHIELSKWCERHPNRGVQYTPVALLWDFYSGWVPGRRVPALNRPYHVWGNIPYAKGHHQIDMLFRALFPGYEDSGFYHDERGFLTPTPCGDIFDVLLSNVPRFVLNRYNAAVIVGPTKIKGQLLLTIRDFIDRGGSVAVTTTQLTRDSEKIFGVIRKDAVKTGRYARMADGTAYNEAIFTYQDVEIDEDTTVLAATYDGAPLALLKRTHAGGELLVFTSDYGLSDKVTEVPEKTDYEIPLPPVHLLLKHMEALLLPWLEKWNIVDIQGNHAVQYLTNLSDKPDDFIVAVLNNAATPWKGTIRFKKASISGGMNWMNDTEIMPCRELNVAIGPCSAGIFELKSSKPLVRFKEAIGPVPTGEELALKSEPFFEKIAAGDRPRKTTDTEM